MSADNPAGVTLPTVIDRRYSSANLFLSSSLLKFLNFQAVDGASAYEGVLPALAEVKAMGVKQVIGSSLSHAAIMRFLEKFSLSEFFSAIWSRDNAEGIKDRNVLS